MSCFSNGTSWLGFCFFSKACPLEPTVLSGTGGAATQPFGQHCECAEKRGPRSGGRDPASRCPHRSHGRG